MGETENALHIRMNSHCSGVTTKKPENPVSAHLNQPGHSLKDLGVMGLEKFTSIT